MYPIWSKFLNFCKIDILRLKENIENIEYIYIYIYIYLFIAFLNQSLEKIQLESKLKFSFVSFPYKLNCLDFCYYFFSELMSIIFILFLFEYFVCEDIEYSKP